MPSPAEARPIISARNLSMHYPIRRGILRRTEGYFKAVDNVTLDVREGETLGLVGESGSGKSTLGRMLIGLLAPTSGTASFEGMDLSTARGADRSRLRQNLQIVFQDSGDSFDPRMQIRDIVAEGPRALGLFPRSEVDKRVCQVLDLVGLPASALGKYPHEFSGGQRQRIGIARALIMKPKVIVADEPISALDVSIQAQVLTLFNELRASQNLTYIFISHNIAAVRYVADRIAVMLQGSVVELGDCEEILTNPRHIFTKTLLAAVPGSGRHYEGVGEDLVSAEERR